jgi:hypothetical protein
VFGERIVAGFRGAFQPEQPGGKPGRGQIVRRLASYADMITVLLAFFGALGFSVVSSLPPNPPTLRADRASASLDSPSAHIEKGAVTR